MAVESCNKFCNDNGVSKFCYLSCTTIVLCGFILEILLFIILAVPFMEESKFHHTFCNFNIVSNGKKPFANCTNPYSGVYSFFKCRTINVKYQYNESTNTGIIYDTYLTYSYYRNMRCSSSPCMEINQDNDNWVDAFTSKLQEKSKFSCYYHIENKNELLLFKLNGTWVGFLAFMLPVFCMLIGLFVILSTWSCAGCSVWDDKEEMEVEVACEI